jgi:predicted DNA-binding transcriptional regulator YafY
MRSGRQIALLLNLQTRGGATAPALAADLGVSIRTIYRDVEQLSEAGVPVYAERGNGGGIRLVEGYRTRLTGLDLAESEALSLAGWSTVADALGVGSAAAGAQRKLLAAIPSSAATKAGRTRERIHFDLARWYDATATPQQLPQLARAVWDQRKIRIDYTSWTARTKREVDPLGLVLKNATWYLIARHLGKIRTYRVSEIASLELLEGTFTVPDDFDLPAFWDASKARFEDSLVRGNATLRLSERAEPLLANLGARAARLVRDPLDPNVVTVPIESTDKAAREFLAFGDAIEVLGPPELRSRLASLASATAALYR